MNHYSVAFDSISLFVSLDFLLLLGTKNEQIVCHFFVTATEKDSTKDSHYHGNSLQTTRGVRGLRSQPGSRCHPTWPTSGGNQILN